MSFYTKLFYFWLIVSGVAIYAWSRPDSLIAQAAFKWIGPKPKAGEILSRYQLRWAFYCMGWFVQILFVMTLIYIIFMSAKNAYSNRIWLQVVYFALPLGASLTFLAAAGFAFKAAKAKLIGPNLIYDPQDVVALRAFK